LPESLSGRNLSSSAEIAEQDDVAADLATSRQQLLSVGGPVEIKDPARGRIWLFVSDHHLQEGAFDEREIKVR
jgi:hypothetical protein